MTAAPSGSWACSPDLYSIKVTLAAFVPAMKKGILVQPGMASVLNVNLNTLFSSIQFAYPPIENGSLMSDEWKWVLRSASPTRPVLRFSGDAVARSTGESTRRSAVFSDTRGVFRVSAGEGSRGLRHRQRGGHGDGLRTRHLALRK